MLSFKSPVVLQMQAGQLIHCGHIGRMSLRVVQGRVWVTQANDRRDYFLGPEATLELYGGAEVLIGVEGESAQVSLTPAPSLGGLLVGVLAALARQGWQQVQRSSIRPAWS